jgi:hypothetical protein
VQRLRAFTNSLIFDPRRYIPMDLLRCLSGLPFAAIVSVVYALLRMLGRKRNWVRSALSS